MTKVTVLHMASVTKQYQRQGLHITPTNAVYCRHEARASTASQNVLYIKINMPVMYTPPAA